MIPEYRPLEWTDDKVTRFWRWQGRFPQTYFTFQFGRRIARRLRTPLTGRRTVLDYGCGPGFLIPHLASLGKEITAADFSPEAVQAANDAHGGTPGFRGAMTVDRLIGSGVRFDAAVSIEVIEHLSDTHLAGFFDNLRRLLRPDGLAIITTPNDEDMALSMVYCPDSDRVFHRWQHLRSWSAESLAASVAGHGFAIEHVYTTDFAAHRISNPIAAAKRLAKRFVGRPEKLPHLVCIARLTVS